MRIWFIHPKYYDKKGLLAQWNEGLILRNIVYGKKNKITLEKMKKQKLNSKKLPNVDMESGEFKPKGWVNHPHSKRILRYHKCLHKVLINTYLYYLRDFGMKEFNIKFKEEYIEMEYVDHFITFPILNLHVEKDYVDLLDKMKVRDNDLFEKALTENISTLELIKPFYLTDDISEYQFFLDDEYLAWCDQDLNKIIGTEIVFDKDLDYSHLESQSKRYFNLKDKEKYNEEVDDLSDSASYDTALSFSDDENEADETEIKKV